MRKGLHDRRGGIAQMRLPALLLAIITQAASDAPLELVAQLRAVQRDSPLLDSFNSNDAFADVPAPRARARVKRSPGAFTATTVAFQYEGGTVCCVDSRVAGRRSSEGFGRKKSSRSERVLGTMAGSAADCVSWLRLLSALSKLHL